MDVLVAGTARNRMEGKKLLKATGGAHVANKAGRVPLKLERAPSLTDAAAGQLGRAISLGHFRAGHHLAEVQLSSELGVSRAILREAFRMLAAEGLLEIRRNHGAYVVDPSPDEIEQMSIFRAVTEGMAARLLVAKGDEAAFGRLEDIVIELETSYRAKDAVVFLDLHWQFHQAICKESGNKFLLQSWNSVSRIIRMYQSNALNHRRLLQNNRVFIEVFRTSSPSTAEQLLRGQILKTAYEILGRPIAQSVRAYVKLFIDDNGEVKKFVSSS